MSFAEKTKRDINAKWRIDEFIPLDKSGTEQNNHAYKRLFNKRLIPFWTRNSKCYTSSGFIRFNAISNFIFCQVLRYVLVFFFPKIFTLSSFLVFQLSRDFPSWGNQFIEVLDVTFYWCKVPPKCFSTLVLLWFYSPAVF